MTRLALALLLLLMLSGCRDNLPTPPGAAAPPAQATGLALGAATGAPSSQATLSPVATARMGQNSPRPDAAGASLENATATPEAPRQAYTTYTVKPGDTLSGIAAKVGMSMADLARYNGIADPNKLRIGQELRIPEAVEVVASGEKILPDGEVVYGPSAADFDVVAFAQAQPGYLKAYKETVEGEELTGPEIVQLVATKMSVSPRILLALIEVGGNWLSNPSPGEPDRTYPAGRVDAARPRLYRQLSWAANQINEGYYGWKGRQKATLLMKDGSKSRIGKGLNPGTVAIHNVLAQITPPGEFASAIAKDGDFMRVYTRLFGDPNLRNVDPLIPADARQPELKLPWPAGDTWFFTGGPHGAWGSGSAWAALDFIPGKANMGGCWDASDYWVTAAAPGVVVRSDDGEVVVDLDGDGKETTGWNVLYMHIASEDRVAVGTKLKAGDRIGHPSCEGGFSTGTHLHMARKVNGEWVAADSALPFTLSGWAAKGASQEYDGSLVKGSDTKESCECRDEKENGLVSDNR